MNYLEELHNYFDTERKNLIISLNHAKETRDDAPSATESHSDTTRNQTEKMVIALEQKLIELDKLVKQIPTSIPTKGKLWKVIESNVNGIKMKVVIVPEGLGGRKVGDIILVSENSELGKKLLF